MTIHGKMIMVIGIFCFQHRFEGGRRAMTEQKRLSLFMIGSHTAALRNIQRWVDLGALSLAGVWEPDLPEADRSLLRACRAPLLTDNLDSLFRNIQEMQLDIIFIGKQLFDLADALRRLKQERTLLIDPGTLWILDSVMEQARMLRELHVSRQEMQTILTYSHEGVQLVDAQGIVRYVNPAFTKITGIAADQRVGRNIFEVSPQGALAKTLQSRKPVLQWRNKVKGTTVEVISNAAPFYVDGKMAGAVTTFQNITEMLELSQRLQERDSEIMQLHAQLQEVHSARYSFDDIIGESPAIREAIALAKKAAETSSTILITGESGTGKELFAHAIHGASNPQKPFVAVNCAAIPETLLESELFGHEKGAFTHAAQKKLGKVEVAHGGTLFLDEIGDMSPSLQAKLLRVLQSKQLERVGGIKPINVQVRIMAATNRNLEQMVQENAPGSSPVAAQASGSSLPDGHIDETNRQAAEFVPPKHFEQGCCPTVRLSLARQHSGTGELFGAIDE
jgi:PAS domain S-box-containing protein